MKSLKASSAHTGAKSSGGIVIDIGTGDGRFVSRSAKANPNKFYIGVDANVKPLEKPSSRAARKPKKGGLPNALFVQAAIEQLPVEFTGLADEIHIHFPWGSLLRAVAGGDESFAAELRRISAPGCLIEIVIGSDPDRDRAELERLGLTDLTIEAIRRSCISCFQKEGFRLLSSGYLDENEWSCLDTTWARKLFGNSNRKVIFLVLQAA